MRIVFAVLIPIAWLAALVALDPCASALNWAAAASLLAGLPLIRWRKLAVVVSGVCLLFTIGFSLRNAEAPPGACWSVWSPSAP